MLLVLGLGCGGVPLDRPPISGSWHEPAVSCGYLKGMGLVITGWTDDGSGTFACSSARYDNQFGTPGPAGLTNNLGFYVLGSSDEARAVHVILNMNNVKEEDAARAELLRKSGELLEQASGRPLPDSIASAIRAGRSASEALDTERIEVVRDDWPTNKGYSIKIWFLPTGDPIPPGW